jgi:uncharacterized protein
MPRLPPPEGLSLRRTGAVNFRDPRYLHGAALFNDEKFFEAHDVWEDLWREMTGPDKNFVQGLIQAASALHQWRKGNLRGARLLFDSSRELWRPYGDAHGGMALGEFRKKYEAALEEIGRAAWEDLPGRLPQGSLRIPFDQNKLFKMRFVG